jgi:hypothetical protein
MRELQASSPFCGGRSLKEARTIFSSDYGTLLILVRMSLPIVLWEHVFKNNMLVRSS